MRIKFIIGIGMVLFLASQAWAESICNHVTMEWIASQAPMPKGTTMVLKQEREGLCEIVISINGRLAPVFAGKDFVITGGMFKQGKSVTRETLAGLSDQPKQKRKAFFKNHIGELKPLVAFEFAPEQGKDFIYVITDPNCPHCKNLLDSLEELAGEAKLELKVILYPVLGPKSRKMAAQAICNRYTYEAYRTMSESDGSTTCQQAEDQIEKTKSLFKSGDVSPCASCGGVGRIMGGRRQCHPPNKDSFWY